SLPSYLLPNFSRISNYLCFFYPDRVFFLILMRPPTSTLFPYTTLFRSVQHWARILHVDRLWALASAAAFASAARAAGAEQLASGGGQRRGEAQSRRAGRRSSGIDATDAYSGGGGGERISALSKYRSRL